MPLFKTRTVGLGRSLAVWTAVRSCPAPIGIAWQSLIGDDILLNPRRRTTLAEKVRLTSMAKAAG